MSIAVLRYNSNTFLGRYKVDASKMYSLEYDSILRLNYVYLNNNCTL